MVVRGLVIMKLINREKYKYVNKILPRPLTKIALRNNFSFLLGVYAGIYLSQNYEIPRVDDPQALYQKVKDFADKHRKD